MTEPASLRDRSLGSVLTDLTEQSFTVGELLDDAGARLERWSSHRDHLPSMSTVLHRQPHLPVGCHSLELNRLQWRIIGELATPLALSALIERVGVSAFGIFDALDALLTAGVITTAGSAPPAR